MHASDCEFTIKSKSTDPSTTIRELMCAVRHVQEVTLALHSRQEGRVTFTRRTYWREKGRYVLTYDDSLDDNVYACVIVLSERDKDTVEIFPGEKPALALEAKTILCNEGYTVHMIKENKDGRLPQWLH